MNLNETQSASVCQAYCTARELQDEADKLGIKVSTMLDSDGSLFFSPNNDKMPHPGVSCFLRNVQDRTPKEIDQFKADWIATLQKGLDTLRKERIAALRAELAELEKQ